MRDKLLKILKVRIDAINRNIDNLNYLNGELEKNTADLNYIQEKIELFAANNILNFDNLSRDDFEKILTMIDSNVADVFQDKTCNYQGIMYIIQGIRQGVSLELTDAQANAIRLLIGEMINKKASLEDVIVNLNESKMKLPETEMAVLTSSLKNFQTIISKIEENLYVIEVDDIISSLEFANVPLEEKVGIFEFLLKYNTNIYTDNQTQIPEAVKEEDYSLQEINVPEFHYEPINIYNDEEKDETKNDVPKVPSPVQEEEPAFEDKFEDKYGSLDETSQIPLTFPSYDEVSLKDEPEETETKSEEKEEKFDLPVFDVVSPFKEIEAAPLSEIEVPTFNEEIIKTIKEEPAQEEIKITPPAEAITPLENSSEKKDDFEEIKPVSEIETSSPKTEPEVGSETQELEDIIGKIDARLKEMEMESKTQKLAVASTGEFAAISEEQATTPELLVIFDKFGINKEQVTDLVGLQNTEVEQILDYLNELGVLDTVKDNKNLLNSVLKLKKEDVQRLVNILKEKLVSTEQSAKDILEEMIETMPVILTSKDKIDTLNKNFDFYKEHNIDIVSLFNKYPEMLILDNGSLVANYNKIKDYNITLTNENVKYLLGNRRVLQNLDYYLEAQGSEKGFLGREEAFDGYECVKNNPYKLNNINETVLMKLRYGTETGKKIFGNKPGVLSGEITNPKVDSIVMPNDYVATYFTHDYKAISKEELESLIKELNNQKEVDMTIPLEIENLDKKYKTDDLRYTISGLTFSRLKTIRLYNFLVSKNIAKKDALIIALTYNSVIKQEEFTKIEDSINAEGGN